MLGAIAGDYVGSRWEFNPTKRMDFELVGPGCRVTDDTVMTVAVAEAAMFCADPVPEHYRQAMVARGTEAIDAGYGMHFLQWLLSGGHRPYGSAGNGSCMRVSPVAWLGRDLSHVVSMAKASAAPSHDHPDGIRGAVAVAVAVRMALEGWGPEYVEHHINRLYGYRLDVPTERIRPAYRFMVLARNSAPPAIRCALEAWGDWEGAVRLAVSLGGDADTMAAMAGAIAEAAAWSAGKPGIPAYVEEAVRACLPVHHEAVLDSFMARMEGTVFNKSDLGQLEIMLPDDE